MIQLLFSRTHSIPSAAVRLITASPWSHVDIVTREGTLIGALAHGGVREYSLLRRLDESSEFQVRIIGGDWDKAVAYARSQIGKGYDWRGLLGIELGRHWQDDDKWFCSELAARAAIVAGNTTIKQDVYRVTPGSLYGYAA
jgi:uncharacterized protein YycO